MIQLPQLQEALLVASDTMVARQRRRAQRFRLGLMTSAAALTIGGGAVAGQALWDTLGWEDGNRPSVTAGRAPTEQADVLAPLRRAQTANDRTAVSRLALQSLDRRYAGVRTETVRLLPADGSQTELALVSVAQVRSGPVGGRQATADALCAFSPDATAVRTVALACFTRLDLTAGRATLVVNNALRGLVPDGVASVRVAGSGGAPYVAPVADNVFAAPLSALPDDPQLSWLDPTGNPLPFADGTTARRPDVPSAATTELPPELHDCGVANGGVVPRRIRCGAAARKYTPPPYTQQYESQKP